MFSNVHQASWCRIVSGFKLVFGFYWDLEGNFDDFEMEASRQFDVSRSVSRLLSHNSREEPSGTSAGASDAQIVDAFFSKYDKKTFSYVPPSAPGGGVRGGITSGGLLAR